VTPFISRMIQFCNGTFRETESRPPYRHAFCRTCGSPLPVALEGPNLVVLHAGVLDGEPETWPFRHIFVGRTASRHTITDKMPQFEQHASASERLPRNMKG
jgi:hypothetical protein